MTLPKLGIVIPSYNQAPYIAQAIESVLDSKSEVSISLAVIDGGSNDGACEVIRRYEKHIDYWVSEPDRGQSHAINKGLKAIHYDVWGYLNSDDYYLPGALNDVVECFAETKASWVTGTGRYFSGEGDPIRDMVPVSDWTVEEVILGYAHSPIMVSSQVSNFMTAEMLDQIGYFDENLHYTMDMEFNLRAIFSGVRPWILSRVLGMARLHDSSKTVSQGATQFPREFETALRSLNLMNNPELAAIRDNAVHVLSRRNALNVYWGETSPTVACGAILMHLSRYPVDAWNREVLGALRRWRSLRGKL